MISKIILKESKIFLKMWLPLIILMTIFIYFLFSSLIINSEIILNIPQMEISVFGIIYVSHIYRKYNNTFFLKNLSLENQKFFSKSKLFIFITTIIFITFFIMLGIVLFFNQVMPFDYNYSMIAPKFKVLWSKTAWGIIFYAAFWESLIIVIFLYFINHFIKNVGLLYGVLTIMLITSVLGSTVIWNHFWFNYKYYNNTIYLVKYLVNPNIFFWINFFLLPWSQFSMLTGDVFNYWWSYQNYEKINGFELLYKSFFLTNQNVWLTFTPYLYTSMIVCLIFLTRNLNIFN